MSVSGPIIIIDDDDDDQQLVCDALHDLGIINPPKLFGNCEDVLNYLLTTSEKPFIILSDVNLPVMSGKELQKRINENPYLRKKAIPFIFFTTTADERSVEIAYELNVQGYFEKAHGFHELKATLKVIVDYWKLCKHPNNYK